MSNEVKRSDARLVVEAGGQEHSHRRWTNTIPEDQYQRSMDSLYAKRGNCVEMAATLINIRRPVILVA